MTLVAGTRLGPYEIVAPLGAGGMGEVYRAKDPRLGREVAVKLVLAGAAHDPDRLRRFEQEARATSALNHPNLLTVFDFGDHDGQPFLVTELLEGRTLRAALEVGEPIAVRTAVDWGAQIARGLAAAHEKGIVHRDLKPENLFVTDDSRVKILDFGLAKLTLGDESTLASATTIAGGATASGVILGTAGYMAPEQVRGEKVEARADLFSLGCVLYELFGGRRAFHGETAIESLNAILREEPRPLSELRADLPPGLARLTERCLEKSAARRFHDAADLAWALESAATGSSAISAAALSAPPRGKRPLVVAAAIAATAALVGLAVGSRLGRSGGEPAPSWSGERLIGGAVFGYCPRPSPDGSLVAFMTLDDSGQSQVAVLRRGESRFTLLSQNRTRGPALTLAWSADGSSIYFNRALSGSIYRVSVLGGDERLVLENAGKPTPLADGTLLATRGQRQGAYRLVRFSSERAEVTPVGPEFSDLSAPGPEGTLAVFPDGREAVHLGLRQEDVGGRGARLWAIDLETGAARDLAPDLDFPRAGEQITLPAVAVDPTRDEALVVATRGDLHVVMAVPRSGNVAARPLLHLTASPFFLSVGRDGSLFLDQVEVSGALLRIGDEGGEVRRVARFVGAPGRSTPPLELPDGSVLFSGAVAGASRLLVARPGRAPVPFAEVGEETSGPACELDDEHVAFFIGTADERQVAIATFDGRIVRRIPTPGPGAPSAFAALGDGKRLLYGLGERLLALDTTDGTHRVLTEAASTATVDPLSRELVTLRRDSTGDRFERLAADGSPRRTYGVRTELFYEPWSAAALDRRGRLLVTAGSPASWWVFPGRIDLEAGSVRPLQIDFGGDIFAPSWGRDGSILAIGWEYSINAWRFARDETRPAKPAP